MVSLAKWSHYHIKRLPLHKHFDFLEFIERLHFRFHKALLFYELKRPSKVKGHSYCRIRIQINWEALTFYFVNTLTISVLSTFKTKSKVIIFPLLSDFHKTWNWSKTFVFQESGLTGFTGLMEDKILSEMLSTVETPSSAKPDETESPFGKVRISNLHKSSFNIIYIQSNSHFA